MRQREIPGKAVGGSLATCILRPTRLTSPTRLSKGCFILLDVGIGLAKVQGLVPGTVPCSFAVVVAYVCGILIA